MKKLLTLIALISLLACAEKPNEYVKELKGTGGLFRGIELKDSRETVMNNENADYLIIDEKVYLRYEYPIDENNKEAGNYKVEYYFDGEDQLHELIMEIFIVNKEKSKEVYNELYNSFVANYKEPTKNHEGYYIWKGKTHNTNKLEIAILDDSKFTENSGYISLQLNDFDY